MLILYDPLEDYLNEFNRHRNVIKLEYYASEITELIGLLKNEELKDAVDKAIKICAALHIPVDENFRTIFRFTGNALITDWKLSALACYLVTINANPSNPIVAKAQIFFTLKNNPDVEI